MSVKITGVGLQPRDRRRLFRNIGYIPDIVFRDIANKIKQLFHCRLYLNIVFRDIANKIKQFYVQAAYKHLAPPGDHSDNNN